MMRLVTKVTNKEVWCPNNQNFANRRNFPIAAASMIGTGSFDLNCLTNHDVRSIGRYWWDANGLEREDIQKNSSWHRPKWGWVDPCLNMLVLFSQIDKVWLKSRGICFLVIWLLIPGLIYPWPCPNYLPTTILRISRYVMQSVTNIFKYSNPNPNSNPNIYLDIRSYHFLDTNIFRYSFVSTFWIQIYS